MRRAIAIAVAGASLGGCSSFSLDAFKPTPPTVQLRLESIPPGADAVTSLGPGCKTPCAVAVSPPDAGFSVTYTMNRFQPATVPVDVIRNPSDYSASGLIVDPNPVVAELQPAGPPPKAARKAAPKARPRPPKAAAAPAAASPFPEPAPVQPRR